MRCKRADTIGGGGKFGQARLEHVAEKGRSVQRRFEPRRKDLSVRRSGP